MFNCLRLYCILLQRYYITSCESHSNTISLIPLAISFSIISCSLYKQLAVAQPLRYPSQDLVDHYDHTSIVAVRDSSCFFAIAVTLLLVPRVVIWIAHEFCTINVVNLHLLDDWSAEEGGGVHHRGVGIGGVGNGGGRTRSLDDLEDDVVFEDTL